MGDHCFRNPLRSIAVHAIKGRAPGKIILFGEHAVVYGRPALAIPINQLQATEVPGTEQGMGPFLSADGESIGFWAPDQLKKVSISGGAPVTIADVSSSPSGASWGADDMILYGQPEGVMQVRGASGTPEALWKLLNLTLLIPRRYCQFGLSRTGSMQLLRSGDHRERDPSAIVG